MATRKQIAAARKNIKKAQAARRRGKKKGSHKHPHKACRSHLSKAMHHLRAAMKGKRRKGCKSML